MSNFNVEILLGNLNVNLNEADLTNSMPVDDHYEKFYKKIVDKFAPLRKATRKEKQLHAKPWLTPGLFKSINHRNDLFKKLYKNYIEKLLKIYENYGNLLNRTINTAKKKNIIT